MSFYLGKLWIVLDRGFSKFRFYADPYAIYRWEVYLPWCRITWLSRREGPFRWGFSR